MNKNKVNYYRILMFRGEYEDLYFYVKEDIDNILNVPSQKRNKKQKQLLDYLNQLLRKTKKRKLDMGLLNKIADLL